MLEVKMPKVLIADKMSEKAKEIFVEKGLEVDIKTGLDKDELISIAEKYDGIVVRSSTKITEKVLKKASNLKIVGRAGIGVDNIDVDSATENGVVVMNTPFGNAITTAEHAIALILGLMRNLPQANISTHAGKWEKSKYMGQEVTGKVLGIIGCGNIGSIVADRAKGLRMRVLSYDPFLTPERANILGVKKVELDELLQKSDIISLHVPMTEQTKNILNKDTLKKCKKGVKIINCARGGLIDEEALVKAIENGIVDGAAIDVYEVEPAKESILFGNEKIICTPHLGASTIEAQNRIGVELAEKLNKILNG